MNQETTSAPSTAKTEATASITFDNIVSIRSINQLFDSLYKEFENRTVLEIDASYVTSIDTAAMQLLTVLKREAIETGKKVTFDFPSETFISAAQLLDLDKILEINRPASGLF